MKRVVLSLIAVTVVTTAAHADVTMKQTTSGKGPMGVGGAAASTTYIKGLKMRTDTVRGDTTSTMIFDVENQKLYMFDSNKKEADVYEMGAFGAKVSGSIDSSGIRTSVKANGQTKQVLGKTANGYDIEVTVPATMGGREGMKMTMTLSGPAWIVKGAPGTEDFMRFYKGAAEKGWIFSDPRAAQVQPGQAKAMAEMYKQLAETGGIPYEQEMSMKASGEGPMAGIMAKMGNMSMTSTMQSLETTPVDAVMFAPPAGYKLNQKK